MTELREKVARELEKQAAAEAGEIANSSLRLDRMREALECVDLALRIAAALRATSPDSPQAQSAGPDPKP